jgi:hypothetical protein
MNNSIKEDSNNKKPKIIKISVGLFIFIVGLWVLAWYFLLNNPYLVKWEERASFGEMFGVINALFAGLAFAGVIITIYLQTQELALQRQELVYTRNEIRGQKEQLAIQNATLQQQSFDNKFFQLLNFHHNIVNSIDISKKTNVGFKVTKGSDCFTEMYENYKTEYNSTYANEKPIDVMQQINKSYNNFFKLYQNDIGHYFRNLYHILKFIDKSEITDKRFYTNLVRAQLSTYELVLLFYNCLSQYGFEKAKPLIEKYSLLKSMPQSELIDIPPFRKEEHLKQYNESAFKTVG